MNNHQTLEKLKKMRLHAMAHHHQQHLQGHQHGNNLNRTEFEDLDELRAYLTIESEKPSFETAHQKILDERLADRANNPDDHFPIPELRASLNTTS